MSKQLEIYETTKLPDKQIVETFNVHGDYIEALLERLLKVEKRVSELEEGLKNE